MSAEYTYRRKLRANEAIPAVAAGIGAGLAVFYVMRLLLQRTAIVARSARLSAHDRTRKSFPPAVVQSSD